MVSIGELGLAGTSRQASDVVPQTNMLQVAGDALEGVGKIVQQKEERDSKAFQIAAGSELQLYGTQALEEARNEVEDPNKIGDLFFSKFNAKKDELLKNAPNDIAKNDFQDRFLQMQASFGSNAIRMQADEVQATRMIALDEALNKKINFVRNGGSFSDIMQSIEGDLANASAFTSPSELMKLKQNALGSVKSAHLDSLFESGDLGAVRKLINNEDFNKDISASQIGAYRNAIKRQEIENQEKASIRNIMNGEATYIDPKDKKAQKSVDLVFGESLADGFQQGDPQAMQQSINLSANTGIVPNQVKSFVRSAYVSGDTSQKNLAYQYITDLNNQNPNALTYAGIDKKLQDEAFYYTALKNDGVPEQDAINIVNTKFRDVTPAITEARKIDLKKDGSAFLDTPDVDLIDVYDNAWFSDPDLLPAKATAYKAKYKELYDSYYLQTGDVNVAKKRANEVFNRNHGTTKVMSDNETIMDYPPEKFYSHPLFKDPYEGDITYMWLRDQMAEDAKGALNKDVSFEDLQLVPDSITEQEVKRGVAPSYPLFIQTEDEGLQYIDRIKFDLQKAITKRSKYLEEQRQLKKNKNLTPNPEYNFK
jgi:hypothetical protein